eukprot:m.52960 g.52960  ORF g.52960 m.52960 type:complete len:336 (+) comp6723_c0_seq2:91-1098(+)
MGDVQVQLIISWTWADTFSGLGSGLSAHKPTMQLTEMTPMDHHTLLTSQQLEQSRSRPMSSMPTQAAVTMSSAVTSSAFGNLNNTTMTLPPGTGFAFLTPATSERGFASAETSEMSYWSTLPRSSSASFSSPMTSSSMPMHTPAQPMQSMQSIPPMHSMQSIPPMPPMQPMPSMFDNVSVPLYHQQLQCGSQVIVGGPVSDRMGIQAPPPNASAMFYREATPERPRSRPGRKILHHVVCNNKSALDARWPEWLLDMPTKDLNRWLKHKSTLSADDIVALKQARRRKKNRKYAKVSREKREAAAADAADHPDFPEFPDFDGGGVNNADTPSSESQF